MPRQNPRRSFHSRRRLLPPRPKRCAASKKPARIGCISTSWMATSSITFPSAPPSSRRCANRRNLPLDVHLMIEHPDHYVPRFRRSRARIRITVHVEPEAKHDVAQTLRAIRAAGCRAGLIAESGDAIRSGRTASSEHRSPAHHDRASRFRRPGVPARDDGKSEAGESVASVARAPRFDIEVDGGINAETAKLSIENGANVLVAGTSIFRAGDYAAAIGAIRGA